MDEVAKWSDQDRADLFQTVAAERDLSEQIIEKDFWVCWTLKRLFTLKDPPVTLLFKGGTSLSKAYGLIERFSEDIDLAFAREELGLADEIVTLQALGSNERRRRLERLQERCTRFISDTYLPRIVKAFQNHLATAAGDGWRLELDPADVDGQTVFFHFPRHVNAKDVLQYIRPMVRLELGARSDHEPSETRSITPYAAHALPKVFQNPRCDVTVLSAGRTFWEKVTLLHKWRHAQDGRALDDRLSRHYYDVHQLYRSSRGAELLRDTPLLDRVVAHKQIFFPQGWASYATAKPGTLSIVPTDARRKELAADYDKMAEMIFGKVPAFEEILESVAEIERRVNNAAKTS